MSLLAATAPDLPPRRSRRPLSWVSKSDVTSYLRCPYAFWQIDSGALMPSDAIDALGEKLIEEGMEFERSVIAEAVPPAPKVELEDALAANDRIYELPLLRNDALRLRGVPDAVDPEDGDLIPIEIKSHREVRRSDELELAFYWKLLAPYRSGDPGPARGRLIVRRDGEPHEIEVELTPERFTELEAVIAQVRLARREGVRPRVCGCTVCSGPLRQQIAQQTWAGRDLTLIWGIGRQIAPHLEALGITDFDALDQHHPEEVAELLRTRRVSVSAAQVRGWSEHARSYREGRAVMFGPPPRVEESFIALDLEYDEAARVWLTAVLICDGDLIEHNYFWADTRRQEREALMALEAIYETYPNLPIITWSGVSADLPKLRDATRRHRLDRIASAVEARHVDLFQHATKTMRVPHPELSLKAVGEYFGVPRFSQISDGLAAQFLYDQYCATRDPDQRARLQADLIAYNRDDLEATAAMARIIRAGPESWPDARVNGWDEHRALDTPPPRRLRPRDPSEPTFRERARLRRLARVGQRRVPRTPGDVGERPY